MNSIIKVNKNEIPQETQIAIAKAARDMVLRILSQPGGREALEKKKAEIRERRQRENEIHKCFHSQM